MQLSDNLTRIRESVRGGLDEADARALLAALEELENIASQLAHAVLKRHPMAAQSLAAQVLERTDP